MQRTQLDPRIGMLASGKFYAFASGYGMPEVVGTLQQVEQALGIQVKPASKSFKTFDVVMRFEYPAWDEKDGIAYPAIAALSKADANKQARAMAERNGHAVGGRGRYTFTATEVA